MSENYTHLYNGLDNLTPVLNGTKQRYINFDNAASTPPLARAERAVEDFMQTYSSVHRGTGFKSQLATHIFEETRDIIMNFVGGNHEDHVCIFGKNTSKFNLPKT